MLKNVCRKGNYPTLSSGNVNWYNYYGEHYRVFFKKIKIGLMYDSGITLQGIYPKKTLIQSSAFIPTAMEGYKKRKC